MKANDRIARFPRSHLIPQKLHEVTIIPNSFTILFHITCMIFLILQFFFIITHKWYKYGTFSVLFNAYPLFLYHPSFSILIADITISTYLSKNSFSNITSSAIPNIPIQSFISQLLFYL